MPKVLIKIEVDTTGDYGFRIRVGGRGIATCVRKRGRSHYCPNVLTPRTSKRRTFNYLSRHGVGNDLNGGRPFVSA